ncbi:hypothetical protein [Hyphomicrobium sp.]|uniref:hypothetical protein n=1 Tax=Hyphomicrobium sp. TaxID=82 RepID=UPI003F718965
MRLSTSNFREIIAVSGALSLIVALFGGIVAIQAGYSPPGEKTEPWISQVAQLREELYSARESPGPAIWIVAGSNGLYGVNSRVIEEATGFHVRNYALHAGMHPDLLFSQIRGKVRSGDIIVGPLEWLAYNRRLGNRFDYSNYLHHFSGSVNPDLWTLYRLYTSVPLARWMSGLWSRVLGNSRSFFGGAAGKELKALWVASRGKADSLAYTYEAVNEYGDINLGRPMTRKTWIDKSSFTVPGMLTDNTLAMLASWNAYFERQGAKFLLVPPVMLEGNNDRLVTTPLWVQIERIRSQLAGTVTPLKCNPADSVMASLYRMDTIYHLNSSGAEFWSKKLAACLRRIIAGEEVTAAAINPEIAAKDAAAAIAGQRLGFGLGGLPFQTTLRALTAGREKIVEYYKANGRYPTTVAGLPDILTYVSDGGSYRLFRKTDGGECTVVAANWPNLISDLDTKGGDPTLCQSYGYRS